jgi:type I restriction enzyme, S subunit
MKRQLVRLGDVAAIERDGISPSAIREGTRYVGLEHIDGTGGIKASTVAQGELASTKFRFSSKHVLYGKLRPYLRKIARLIFLGFAVPISFR